MKPVLTPRQAAELDRETQARGVPAELLMERAGRAVARAAVDLIGGVYGRRAVVVCGKGNNGGDGLVAARHLARWGMRVAVSMSEPTEDVPGPAATNLRVTAPASLAGLHPGLELAITRQLVNSGPVRGEVVYVGTGLPGTELRADPKGKIALIDRGD